MKKLLIVVLLFCSGHLYGGDLDRARPELVGMSSERLARIKPFMARYAEQEKLAGIVTVIARRGKIVHFETVGKLNLETGEPAEPDDLFRIYSMTKPIVTVAAMMLYEQGKFQLDEPVANYLPAFEDTRVLVDGRELMSHTAGLTSCGNRKRWRRW